MADKITKSKRSWNMSRIRSKNTSIENMLRKRLWAEGVRGYRVGPSSVPGRPDVAFTRSKVAVFVDGCFWHACPLCYREPSSNKDYWIAKIERNRHRDQTVSDMLAGQDWIVLRLWEHEIESDLDDCVQRIMDVLANRRQ